MDEDENHMAQKTETISLYPAAQNDESRECGNYRTMVLISHTGKVLLKIIQHKMERVIKHDLTVGDCMPQVDWRASQKVQKEIIRMFTGRHLTALTTT